ncbi:uncharacterized protein CELE_F15D4.6 [Caenorhabditis elegans]|uniref:Uncharacterized protein n=1 Tax=Caenorhabditis elegans TaxID=6239 RepID=Q93514_CAEEL|nr:Uncharacterized protein CELE_F15D4.6 [Caenorhabditis elegans]CAB02489.2 Uncharacterized protein CELE_F15D4.6 [Caenorhabditis elegans]|eukprot:NP_496807.2 Uncharacterized protein CELE_F15D4.6 [Caenorhabditis elegans]
MEIQMPSFRISTHQNVPQIVKIAFNTLSLSNASEMRDTIQSRNRKKIERYQSAKLIKMISFIRRPG